MLYKIILLVLFFIGQLTSSSFGNKIEDATVEKFSEYDVITIKVIEYTEPKAMLLDDRLIVDFKNCETKLFKQIYKKNPRIKSIRGGQFKQPEWLSTFLAR